MSWEDLIGPDMGAWRQCHYYQTKQDLRDSHLLTGKENVRLWRRIAPDGSRRRRCRRWGRSSIVISCGDV